MPAAYGTRAANMVGSGNINPPSIALLAYAAAQAGLVIAAGPSATRLLARPRLWRRVKRLNEMTMTVYLWHFVQVIVIAVAFYPTRLMPQPAIGTVRWWELRPAWFALLIVVLVPLVAAVMRAERPMSRLPAGIGPPGPWSRTPAGRLAASMFGLARLAIAGFAPGGNLSALARPPARPAWPRPWSPAAPRPQVPGHRLSARSNRSSHRRRPKSAAAGLLREVLGWQQGAGGNDADLCCQPWLEPAGPVSRHSPMTSARCSWSFSRSAASAA